MLEYLQYSAHIGGYHIQILGSACGPVQQRLYDMDVYFHCIREGKQICLSYAMKGDQEPEVHFEPPDDLQVWKDLLANLRPNKTRFREPMRYALRALRAALKQESAQTQGK